MGDFLINDFWVYGNKIFRIVVIILGAHLTLRFFGALVESGASRLKIQEKRFRTVSGLIKSIIRYTIDFLAIVLILQELHIDTTSFIAGAGIIGLALGVGAQSLIKDFITGFFIILEDQYAIGDYIVCGDMAGIVEDMGFRVTKLRDSNGVLHIIPNGGIARISNYTRGAMQAAVTVPVGYDADLNKALELIKQACELTAQMPEVLDGPNSVGLIGFGAQAMEIRITAKTVPLEQTRVEANLRYQIKTLFDKHGIHMFNVTNTTGQGAKVSDGQKV